MANVADSDEEAKAAYHQIPIAKNRGNPSRRETFKRQEAEPTAEGHGENVPLAQEGSGDPSDEEDDLLVAKSFEGVVPIGEGRRREALKRMQVKARKMKEKREKQKREMIVMPHSTPSKKKPDKDEKSSAALTWEDGVQLLRNKSEELLQAATEQSSYPELEGIFDDVQNTTKALEEAIYAMHPLVGNTYRKKVRTIVMNLKENPELRINLLTGVITPKELASMSMEEMASSEVRKMREEAAKQGLVERIGSTNQPTSQNFLKPQIVHLTDRQLERRGI